MNVRVMEERVCERHCGLPSTTEPADYINSKAAISAGALLRLVTSSPHDAILKRYCRFAGLRPVVWYSGRLV